MITSMLTTLNGIPCSAPTVAEAGDTVQRLLWTQPTTITYPLARWRQWRLEDCERQWRLVRQGYHPVTGKALVRR